MHKMDMATMMVPVKTGDMESVKFHRDKLWISDI
jgi:hypothetical protein